MNRKMKACALICCVMLMLTGLFACGSKDISAEEIWENAIYKTDTELGNGSKCVLVNVHAEGKSVVFKINTDKETLGDALLEYSLVSGEHGPYGHYIKTVNGIEADYDKTGSYWGISKNGQSITTGADGEKITGGEEYTIEYTKM